MYPLLNDFSVLEGSINLYRQALSTRVTKLCSPLPKNVRDTPFPPCYNYQKRHLTNAETINRV